MDKGVPDKLIYLLQCIQSATAICVERKIFDQDDVVVKVNFCNQLMTTVALGVNLYPDVLCSAHWLILYHSIAIHRKLLFEKIDEVIFQIENIDLLRFLCNNRNGRICMKNIEQLAMYQSVTAKNGHKSIQRDGHSKREVVSMIFFIFISLYYFNVLPATQFVVTLPTFGRTQVHRHIAHSSNIQIF